METQLYHPTLEGLMGKCFCLAVTLVTVPWETELEEAPVLQDVGRGELPTQLDAITKAASPMTTTSAHVCAFV